MAAATLPGTPPATLPASTRAPRTRRLNRVVLGLLGLLLLALGGAGAAAGFGAFGSAFRTEKIIDQDYRDWVARHDWFWLAVAGGSVVVALLALRWLVAQAASSRLRSLDLEPDRTEGRTVLAAGAVTDALADEIESYRGVRRASAFLVGGRGAPVLVTRVTLDADGDLGEVRRRVGTEAVAHVREALDRPDLPVRLEFRLAPRSRRHVR
jgi:hypothetical protein